MPHRRLSAASRDPVTVPGSRGWRLARTTVFAVTAGQLAALGHLAGGGHPPDGALVLLAMVVSAAALHPFTRRRVALPHLLVATAGGQLLFHLLFQLGTHPTAMTHTASPAAPAAAGPMVAFHLVAAGATALLLAHGESVLFCLFAAWRRTVQRVRTRPAVTVAPSWSVVPAGISAVLLGALLAAVRVVRGPPGAVPAR